MWENHPTTDLLSEKVIQKNVVHQQKPTRIVDLTGMTNMVMENQPFFWRKWWYNRGRTGTMYIYIYVFIHVYVYNIYIHHFIP